MAVALEALLKQLADSGVIAPGKLENFVPPKAFPKNVDELVAELVRNKHLTSFQAAQVAAGKAKSLILGNYTILDRIGAGGMGQVFKAEHRRMKRVVALKMLPPSVTNNPRALARFQREVEAAAKLRHPNIVNADDADEANGIHFLVMEYVDGTDLSAQVKKAGPLPVAKAVNCILQAARGLEYAHAKGVIHRDIKPANLLLSSDGTVKILDMGLARIEASDSTATELTGSGTIMGTVDYMAPEQGVSTKHADGRADIYSLGCSLYFLVAGKPIYEGETVAAKLLAHHTHPIPPLGQGRPEVSPQLEAVFRKMVAKATEDRYPSMREVVAELEKCQPPANARGAWNSQAIEESDLSMAFRGLQIPSIPSSHIVELEPLDEDHHAAGNTSPSRNGALLLGAGGAAALVAVMVAAAMLISSRRAQHTPSMPEEPVAALATRAARQPRLIESARLPEPLKAPFDSAAARKGQEAWASYLNTTVAQINSVGITLVLIPPGEFTMGSSAEDTALGVKMAEAVGLKSGSWEYGRLKEEEPQHQVTISRPFWIGSTAVTLGQFSKFIDTTGYVTDAEQFGSGKGTDGNSTSDHTKHTWRQPGYAVAEDTPVTEVTWNDAVRFCNWLSQQEGLPPCYASDGKDSWKVADTLRATSPGPYTAHGTRNGPATFGYRLPTEAEWEYACRAGTTTPFSFGNAPETLDTYGWFYKNSDDSARPVGLKAANPFGLFDMHGNVWEWCQDFYAGDYYSKSPPTDPAGPASGPSHVGRGGSWGAAPVHARSAFRNNYAPLYRSQSFGFRLARDQ